MWLVLLLVITAMGLIRFGLVDVPLERDEGEYAYAGQLIMDGVPPFAEAYNMKMPGVYYMYALILTIFGQTASGLRMGLILINSATALILFAAFRKRFDDLTSLSCAVFFSVVSILPSVHGFMANTEHFVLLFSAAGFFILLTGLDSKRGLLFFLSGLAFGLGFLMKQHAIVFIAAAGLYLFLSTMKEPRGRRIRIYGLYSIGAVLPLAALSIYLWLSGVFESFIFWTFTYASEYVSSVKFSTGLKYLSNRFNQIGVEAPIITAFTFLGLAAPLWNKELRRQWPLFYGLAAFSFLAISPGFYYRPHYFILLLPALCLTAGAFLASLKPLISKIAGTGATTGAVLGLAVIVGAFSIYMNREVLINMTPTQISRHVYGYNPFPEAVEISKKLREISDESDRIAVLGSEPQIYFYSRRKAATGFMYTYALMEKHPFARKMQKDMISEIERNRPRFVVMVYMKPSWLVKRNSYKLIFQWSEEYLRDNYKVAGRIDVLPPEETVYVWGGQAEDYRPMSRYHMAVFERRKDL